MPFIGPSAAAWIAALIDFVVCFFAEVNRQVDDAAGRHWNSHGDTGQLALQLRNHQTNRFRSTGAGRDDVERRSTTAIRVGVRLVLDILIIRVGVNGRHQT